MDETSLKDLYIEQALELSRVSRDLKDERQRHLDTVRILAAVVSGKVPTSSVTIIEYPNGYISWTCPEPEVTPEAEPTAPPPEAP